MRRVPWKYQAAREAVAAGKLTVKPREGVILGARGNRIGSVGNEYESVVFGWGEHKRISCMTHIVVWEFVNGAIEDPEAEVNHGDGVKLNNSILNLELTDQSGNTTHAYMNGLFPDSLTPEQVTEFRGLAAEGMKCGDIAVLHDVSLWKVREAVSGRTWAAVAAEPVKRVTISPGVVAEVRRRVGNGEVQRRVAESIGLSYPAVSLIVKNKIHKT